MHAKTKRERTESERHDAPLSSPVVTWMRRMNPRRRRVSVSASAHAIDEREIRDERRIKVKQQCTQTNRPDHREGMAQLPRMQNVTKVNGWGAAKARE